MFVTNTITAERAGTEFPLNQPSWLENPLYLAVQEAGACVGHPEGSTPGLGQSLWPGRCCRSRSPFLMSESPRMAVQTRGSTPPAPAAPPGVLTRRRWGWGAAAVRHGRCCRRRVLGPVGAPLGRPRPFPWRGTGTPLLQEAGDTCGLSMAGPHTPTGQLWQSPPLYPQPGRDTALWGCWARGWGRGNCPGRCEGQGEG